MTFATVRVGVCAAAMVAMSGYFAKPLHHGELQSVPPDLVVGTFDDDYGSTHVITKDEWRHGKSARYHIDSWFKGPQFLIAQNDATNPSDPKLWSRIEWMPLDMPPFTWAFCMTVYNAKTKEEALVTANTVFAKRAQPKTGCNGFPFTRMKKR